MRMADSLLRVRLWRTYAVKCCITSTETVGLSGTGAQDGHLDFHTAPELWQWNCSIPPFWKSDIYNLAVHPASDISLFAMDIYIYTTCNLYPPPLESETQPVIISPLFCSLIQPVSLTLLQSEIQPVISNPQRPPPHAVWDTTCCDLTPPFCNLTYNL